MHLERSSVHLSGRGTLPFYLKLSINPALLRAPGTEHQAKRFAEKIKSNEDHDDVDDDSDDASTLASLIFVAIFGGENN